MDTTCAQESPEETIQENYKQNNFDSKSVENVEHAEYVEHTEHVEDIENKMNYKNLERLTNEIECLSKNHHIEIAKILKTNNVKLSENNNGIFVNLNNLNNSTITEIKTYISFLKQQNNYVNIDEDIKTKLENIYFKDN